MTELIVAFSLAVVISATCSVFEAVLYSVPVSTIESLVQEGRRSGQILRRLRKDVERPIAAILSLNTIANTAGAAIAGAAAAEALGHRWVGWFSAFFTLAILIFSEVIPKTAGVVFSRTLAPFIAWPLHILVWIMAPLVWLSRFFTRLISSRRRADHTDSEEDLLMAIRLGLRAGTLRQDEADVMSNILSLGSKTAGDVMTPRTVMSSVNGSLAIEDVRDQAGQWVHSRLPVYDRDPEDIIGIVHRREVLTAIAEDRFTSRLSEVLHPVHFVLVKMSLDRLLRMFLDRKQHLFVVVDEYGGVAGVVTLEDVVEEILGKEIVDEVDEVADMRELARLRKEKALKGRLPNQS